MTGLCFSMSDRFSMILVLLAICLVWTIAVENSSAQTPPPASGDWIISDDTYIEDTRIYLFGNLTVTSSGNLTLVNVTIRLNNTFPGQYNILVESRGRLSLLDHDGAFSTTDATVIHCFNWRYGYAFTCEPGSHLKVVGSIISKCGQGLTEGLTIRTDDASIVNSTFAEGGLGIFIDGCSPVIRNTFIWDCREYGIRVRNGSPVIEDSRIELTSGTGLLAESPLDLDVVNSTISRHPLGGVKVLNGTVSLDDCIISDCSDHGVLLDGVSAGTVAWCDINTIRGTGIHLIGNGTFRLIHNLIRAITGNGIIISESVSEATLGWNHLDGCLNDSLLIQRSFVILNDNVIENSNRSGVVLSESSWIIMDGDIIRDNAKDGIFLGSGRYISSGVLENIKVIRNGGTGIYLHDRSMLTLYNSSFRDNGWYGIYCDGGSHVTWHVRSNSSVANEAMRIRGQVDAIASRIRWI